MKSLALRIFELLSESIEDATPQLTVADPYQLLISVILSAQTTDRQVNQVTSILFQAYAAPINLANAAQEDVESIIKSVGYYHVKARNIRVTAGELVNRYGGSVPGTMDELLTLPGVGRKSANVVLGRCFGVPAIIVDTHFGRVVRRVGLASAHNPEIVESEIEAIVPPEIQYNFSMLINTHGREVCKARTPGCEACSIRSCCDFYAVVAE